MKKSLATNKKVLILSFIISTFVLIHYIDLDDKLLFNLFASENDTMLETEQHTYKLKEIKEIKQNLSGITYSPKTDTLFAITNSPRDIYELNKSGEVLRKIDLEGFRDTEDITYIKDDMFAVVDEELSGAFIVNINNNTKVIDIKDSNKKFMINVRTLENFGLEGISYNKNKDILYLVNERNPKKIITVKGFINDTPIVIKEKFEIVEDNDYLGDFSAIYFDDISKNIYILSEESALLGRVDDKKNFSKYLDLSDNEVSSGMTAPEGITKDEKGNIYIVGEPNLFLSIKRTKALN
ncbi:SdiA-regulated domain-containing protein [Arcobacter lanthieri]|uniref:SdiA-regulated domain-containing protein n=1 Tax=Aliarcobacter lanthieri TaxID=1355374 RepID=UPI001920ACAB|nr:SdiA-regulated domain-containing protein [Aliarcobacter lanthieri]MBL3520470.1 SdiA-regulated domain-containing protein [Aliarcobacter lanthieri]